MLLTKRTQIYCISERKKKNWNFLREMCHTAIDAEALWKCRPTKPISGKVPYYLFCLFLFSTSRCEYCIAAETHRLLQQVRNDLVVWSEGHQEKWATKDHVLPTTMQKKTSHLICSQSQGCPEGNLWCIYMHFSVQIWPWQWLSHPETIFL